MPSVRIVQPHEARSTEVVAGDRHYTMHDYFGSHRELRPGVQVYAAVLETPFGSIPPHFHRQDQFQVVVEGTGRLGKHDLRRGTVHYTDGYTSYGPIHSHGERLGFFVIRPVADTGASYMPESREQKARRSGRALAESANLALPVRALTTHSLLATDDGVQARELRIPAGRDLAFGDRVVPGLYLVMAGSLVHGHDALSPGTCLHVDEDESDVYAAGSPDGCVLLHLRFRAASRAP